MRLKTKAFRFTLLQLFVAITAVSVWIGYEVAAGRRQQAAIKAWEAAGGNVDTQESGRYPEWLRARLGEGFCDVVYGVHLHNANIDDDLLREVAEFTELVNLNLSNCDGITDRAIEELRGLRELEVVMLNDTNVTDEVARSLAMHPKLSVVSANRTSIGNEGVEFLSQASDVKVLSLSGTNVSDAGCEFIGKMAMLEFLDLSYTRVTDRGVALLSQCNRLEKLSLKGTRVSNNGLQCLRRLPNLAELKLSGTNVTAEAAAAFESETGCKVVKVDSSR